MNTLIGKTPKNFVGLDESLLISYSIISDAYRGVHPEATEDEVEGYFVISFAMACKIEIDSCAENHLKSPEGETLRSEMLKAINKSVIEFYGEVSIPGEEVMSCPCCAKCRRSILDDETECESGLFGSNHILCEKCFYAEDAAIELAETKRSS